MRAGDLATGDGGMNSFLSSMRFVYGGAKSF